MLEAPKSVINASAVTIGHSYKDSDNLECIPVPAPSHKPSSRT
jgi:hypothetical protein